MPQEEKLPDPDRVMANGQCFLAKRATLLANGGYSSARRSWCDDVTLARHMARNGARVGFLDGAKIIGVRAYSSIGQMWREWGRSIDLKDGTTPFTQFLAGVLRAAGAVLCHFLPCCSHSARAFPTARRARSARRSCG